MSKAIFVGLIAAGMAALVVATTAVGARSSSDSTYVVLYQQQAIAGDAAATMQQAGGSLVYAYPAIGVAIARSSSPSFRDDLLKSSAIENVASTDGLAIKLPDVESTDSSGAPALPNAPASDSDPLSPLQWDMRQINAPQAHAITGGSPSVLVGDIDTGIDFTHPDLAPNVDVADSANCVSGAPVQGTAAQDDNGHGTHTAGTIAAASNGIGIVGVAPNVKIAGIKAGDADGFFFPQAVVCAFMWAATHHVDVTNNSYFADPNLFNCKNDPEQRAIWAAEARAILYAEHNGVTVVAADGNQSEDMAHPSQDLTSPDNTVPEARVVHNNCVVIPVEVPGVIGVSAVGNATQTPSGYLKSFYSSFGVGVTQVAAPGGDSRFGVTAAAPNGRVLSTWPASIPCARKVVDASGAVYCYLQGTSMASPHVAGVAALVVSVIGKGNPKKVQSVIDSTADAQPCPSALPAGYEAIVGLDDLKVQTCQGGNGDNSWYGHGLVDALAAVTHST
jgi:subtilisin family serine protease